MVAAVTAGPISVVSVPAFMVNLVGNSILPVAAACAAWLLVASRGVKSIRDAKVFVPAEKFVIDSVQIRCKLVEVYSDEEGIPIRKNELIKPPEFCSKAAESPHCGSMNA
jgi:hypothetical protein